MILRDAAIHLAGKLLTIIIAPFAALYVSARAFVTWCKNHPAKAARLFGVAGITIYITYLVALEMAQQVPSELPRDPDIVGPAYQPEDYAIMIGLLFALIAASIIRECLSADEQDGDDA